MDAVSGYVPANVDVQQSIDKFWKEAGVVPAPSPRVFETLLFYNSSDDFELYAVVDSHGGNTYHVDGWSLLTLSAKAPPVKHLLECRIGEVVEYGGDTLLLLLRNGGKMPSKSACRMVISIQDKIREHSRKLHAEIREIEYLMRRQTALLNDDFRGFQTFSELSRAMAIIETEIETMDSIEAELAELKTLHHYREIDSLTDDIEREGNLLRSLRDDIEMAVQRQAETLEAHRQRYHELERERYSDTEFRSQERAKYEALYCETLRSPDTIKQDDAVKELRDIVRLSNIGNADDFILRRRLYILRLRCRKSIEAPHSDKSLRPLLSEIEDAINKLK